MSEESSEILAFEILNHLLLKNNLGLDDLRGFVAAKIKMIGGPDQLSESLTSKIDSQYSEFLSTKTLKKPAPVRGIVEGVFDLTHFGHFNAFRQASKMCDELVVGINSSKAVLKAKGLETLFSDEERKQMAAACRWVDESHEIADYYVNLSILDELKADCVMHGDDLVLTPDGKHLYQDFIDINKYR